MPHPLARLAVWSARRAGWVLAAHALLLLALGLALAARWRAEGVDGGEAGRERLALLLYDNDLARVWRPDAPELAEYAAFKERWGSDEVLVAVAEGEGPMQGADLDRLRAWAEALESDEDLRAEVLWVGDLPYAPEGLVFGEPVQPAEAAELLEAARGDALGRALLGQGEGGWWATLLLRVDDEGLNDVRRAALGARVKARAPPAPPGVVTAVTGTSALLGEVRTAILDSLRATLPLTNLVVLATCVLIFRRLRMVPLVLAGVLQGELLSMGLFLLAGRSMNYVSVFLATAIIVVGFATNIHLFTRYGIERSRTGVVEALAAAADEVARPSALSLGTTCAALLALTTAEQVAIVDFGLFSALGTALVLICAYTLGPALLAVFDGGEVEGATGLRLPGLGPLGMAAWGAPGRVLLSCALLLVVALVGLGRVELGSSVRESFVASSAVSRDIGLVGARAPGLMATELQLTWAGDDDAADALGHVRALERALEAGLRVRGRPLDEAQVLSAADAARAFCRAPGRAGACEDGWPRAAAVGSLLEDAALAGAPMPLRREGGSWVARLTLLTDLLLAREGVDLVEEVEAQARPFGEPVATGLAPLWSLVEARVVDDLLRSFALGGLLVALLLGLALRDLRLLAVALPANALPLALVAGGAGFVFAAADIHVNSTAAMFLSITVGLVVDDTLFFLLGFQRRLGQGVAPREAARCTLDEAGPGILVTSACLSLGFATLLPSPFVNARVIGGLTAATVLMALAADLLLLPALCRLVYDRHPPVESPCPDASTLASPS